MTLALFGLEHRLSNDPLYSLQDADYIASSKRGTIRRWLDQYPDLAQSNQEMLSYHAALQMVAVAALRRDGVSMKLIRNMLRFLRTEMENPYPFLTQRFYVGEKQVFLENLETMMEISSTQGQLAWASVILPFLHELDLNEELAVGWWPLGRKNFVLVNPDYGYGAGYCGNFCAD
jgi:hypothetical protein